MNSNSPTPNATQPAAAPVPNPHQPNRDRLLHWPSGVDAVAPGWRPLLDEFLRSPGGVAVERLLRDRLRQGATIYPPEPLRALALTPPQAVRALILGQDPYHGPRQAHGLAFSVAAGFKAPPSLRNILKELERDLGAAPRAEGLIEYWATQGVLLLNTSLTVEQGRAASHARIGWAALTGGVIRQVLALERPLVLMLWGAHAQAQVAAAGGVAGRPHLLLAANHPSPLSAARPPVPFVGCAHFSRANAFLQAHGMAPIDWLGRARESVVGG